MEDNCNEQDSNHPDRQEWIAAIAATFGEAPPTSKMWDKLDDYPTVLSAFMGQNLNHTLFPCGGGDDIQSVEKAFEPGCMKFCITPITAEIFRPEKLYFEFFDESPWNSFFLLETSALSPSGVNSTVGAFEEVLELSSGKYVNRSYFDEGCLGHDESGREIPLPKSYCLASRYLLPGKFLVAAKCSLWILNPSTYDARHNTMTHDEIRQGIQDML